MSRSLKFSKVNSNHFNKFYISSFYQNKEGVPQVFEEHQSCLVFECACKCEQLTAKGVLSICTMYVDKIPIGKSVAKCS